MKLKKELFAPVALEMNKYLEEKKRNDKSMSGKLRPTLARPTSESRPQGASGSPAGPRRSDGPQNVLNLKKQKRPPAPPPVPLN